MKEAVVSQYGKGLYEAADEGFGKRVKAADRADDRKKGALNHGMEKTQ